MWRINFIIKANLCVFWNQFLHAAYPSVTKSTATKHRSEQNKTHDGDDDDDDDTSQERATLDFGSIWTVFPPVRLPSLARTRASVRPSS